MTDEVPRYPGVHRRPDSNIYQFGLRVPQDLRDRFPTPWAVRCSLKTADVREANAEAKALQAEWEVRFKELRTRRDSGSSPNHVLDLHVLRKKLLERVEAALARIDLRTAGLSEVDRLDQVESATMALGLARQAREGGWVDEIGAERWVEELAPGRQPAALAEVQAAATLLHELHVEALADTTRSFPLRVRLLSERRALLALGVPSEIVPVRHSPECASVLAPAVGHRIMDAFVAWGLIDRPAKTVSKFRRHVSQFMEMAGNPVLESFSKSAALKFRNDLQTWAIDGNRTAITANNILISVRAIFSVARDQGWIESNPFAGLVVKVGAKVGEGREPWTHDELQTLFNDPIWTEYRLPPERKAGKDAAYWIPLIACYTGARVSEIAQLWTDDVSVSPDGEVIEFRAREDRGQRLKNHGSWRAVPMHSELIRLGLCKYVASTPPGPLFPALPTAGDNGAGGQFGSWFGQFKKAKGFGSPTKTLHSFRHLVATELRLNGASEAQANAITGHAGQGVAGKVYSATIRQQANRLRSIIELLKFPMLEFPELYGVVPEASP